MTDRNSADTKIENRTVKYTEIDGIEYFITTDIGLATALVLKGQTQIRNVEMMRRVDCFLFANNQEVELITRDYLSNNLLIAARPYYQKAKKFQNGLFGAPPRMPSGKKREGVTEIETTDIILAAALISNENHLQRIKESDEGKSIFVIASKSNKKKDVFFQVLPLIYEQMDLGVSVKAFMRELENLGTLLIRTAHPSAPKKGEL